MSKESSVVAEQLANCKARLQNLRNSASAVFKNNKQEDLELCLSHVQVQAKFSILDSDNPMLARNF